MGLTDSNATVTGLLAGSSHLWEVGAFDAEGNGTLGYAILVTNPSPVSVIVSALSLDTNVGFQINATGMPNQTAQVWATTNLSDITSWVMIGSFMPTTSTFSFTDPNASQFSQRFYSVLQP